MILSKNNIFNNRNSDGYFPWSLVMHILKRRIHTAVVIEISSIHRKGYFTITEKFLLAIHHLLKFAYFHVILLCEIK